MNEENTATEQQEQQQEQTLEQLIAGNPALKQQYEAMLQRNRQSWQQEAAAAQSEAEKLANMSEAQRERYQFDKDRKAFQEEKKAFAAQQLRLQMGSELQKLGYSPELAGWITGADAEISMKNLTTFDGLVKAEIQKGLNGQMRGKSVPAAPSSNKAAEDAFLKGFNS